MKKILELCGYRIKKTACFKKLRSLEAKEVEEQTYNQIKFHKPYVCED